MTKKTQAFVAPAAEPAPRAPITTREQWLTALATDLRPAFAEAGSPLPEKVRLSCGFTSVGHKGKRIGECWGDASSGDGTVEIFIKPDQDDAMRVADIVLHELCHAALGVAAKHGKLFRKLATALGLEGKMTATTAGAKALALLTPIVEALGAYPHSALAGGAVKEPKKSASKTRVRCPECDFYATVPVASLEVGRLRCPIHGEVMLTREEKGDDE